MNDISKAMWDKAARFLDSAIETGDINSAICYTSIAECALNLARFAVEHPYLVGGEAEAGLPVPLPTANSPVPQGPTEGPRLWGAP